MRVQFLITTATVSLLSLASLVSCSNPCAAKTPVESGQPLSAPANPCAAKKSNPCAAKSNPCAAKSNPCAAKSNPCAAKPKSN
jgi:hypothetical protein